MSKIPKHAKRVFKGKVFDIYQWPQKMYDGTTKTFESAKRADGVSVIAAVGDKILVLKQKQPGRNWYYSLPGGFVDSGESPKNAAIRELQEETGYKPKKIKKWKEFSGRLRVESTHHVFIAQDCTLKYEPELDGGEIIEVKHYTFEQFLKFSDHPDFHGQNLTIEFLRTRMSPKRKRELKREIFGK